MTKRKRRAKGGTKQQRQARGRLLLATAVLVMLVGLSAFGWIWYLGVTVTDVRVQGMTHAEPEALLELARVDTGAVLHEQDPVLVADRVQRHPWVRTADVSRLPTGTLTIRVQERRPVALALDARGAPSHYLDAEGYQLPLTEGAVYDVPLLHGLQAAYHPVQPVEDDQVRALLDALAELDPETDALVAELELRDGEVWLYTSPVDERGSIPVRLGAEDFASRLHHLHAFWHQAVLAQSDTRFDAIDLRFDSQIITREAVGR